MKKICFVTMGNIYTVPYLGLYKEYLNDPYSIIYWDREEKDENDGTNTYYRFSKKLVQGNKVDKVKGYLQFHNYAKKILEENEFDLVILLQTWGAILLADVLIHRYRGKYIIDIRDYTYEKNPVIFCIEKAVVKHSAMALISSKGFQSFLPPHKYHTVHNIRMIPEGKKHEIQTRNKQRETINIAFIGYVNYQDQHKKLILALKNDPRFHLSFIGTRAKELEAFCIENDARNVTIMDTFDSAQIVQLYQNVDMINNLYGNHTPVLDYALSNKLYFSAQLCIPILVFKDTYMSRIALEYGIGYELDDISKPGLGDELYAYYNAINWKQFADGCNRYLEEVETDQDNTKKKISLLLQED